MSLLLWLPFVKVTGFLLGLFCRGPLVMPRIFEVGWAAGMHLTGARLFSLAR